MTSINEQDRQANRANLMELDEQIELVESGKERLEEVQEKLIDEFMDLFEQWQEVSSNVDQLYEDAQTKLDMTRAMEGDIRVRSAAAAIESSVEVRTTIRNVAGVKVPQFDADSAQSEIDERGYGILGSSARIDETASAYETLVDKIVQVAELKTAISEILEEIKRVKRRINAFEYKILPTLRDEHKTIQRKLMEKERQEVYALKMIKDKNDEEDEQDEQDEDEQDEQITQDDASENTSSSSQP